MCDDTYSLPSTVGASVIGVVLGGPGAAFTLPTCRTRITAPPSPRTSLRGNECFGYVQRPGDTLINEVVRVIPLTT